MNSHTSAAVEGQSIGLVTAIVDSESQSSKEVYELCSLTDCLERFTSGLFILWFKPKMGL